MVRDVSFGQYYPANSFIHKLDPRVKTLFIIAYVVAIFIAKDLLSYVPIAIWLLIVILASRVPPLKILKSLKSVLFIVLFTALLNVFFNPSGKVLWSWQKIIISVGGIELAARLSIRIFLIVAGTSLVTFTTTPMAITDGIESLLSPLKVIKFPVHDFAIIINISLRFIPILLEEVDKIMMAQKARGAAFDNGGLIKKARALLPVLIPLFVSAFRRADELALALDARCYNATPKRTKYKVLKLSYRDLIAFFYTLLLFFGVIAVNTNFWGLISL